MSQGRITYVCVGRECELPHILYIAFRRMEMSGVCELRTGLFEEGFKALRTRFNAVKWRQKEVDSFIF